MNNENNNDEFLDEKSEDEIMDTIHVNSTEVIAKPKNVKKMINKKSVSKKLTPEEERKLVEDNIIGEFYD